MSRYDFDQLLKMWGQDKLTTEQAIGQILQHLQGIAERVGKMEIFVAERQTEAKAMPVKVNAKPKKTKRRKKKQAEGSKNVNLSS